MKNYNNIEKVAELCRQFLKDYHYHLSASPASEIEEAFDDLKNSYDELKKEINHEK